MEVKFELWGCWYFLGLIVICLFVRSRDAVRIGHVWQILYETACHDERCKHAVAGRLKDKQ